MSKKSDETTEEPVEPTADAVEPEGAETDESAEPGPVALTTEELLTRDPGLLVWVPSARPAVAAAVESAGLTLTEDPSEAVYAVVSTRLPKHRISEYADFARAQSLPVVVMVHPTGEDLAVEALCAGADVAIAEGDAESLRSLSGEGPSPEARMEALLDAYENRMGRQPSAPGRRTGAVISAVSGLPSTAAFEGRLAEPVNEDAPGVRIVTLSVSGLDGTDPLNLSSDAILLLHRRIAMSFRNVSNQSGQLYDLGSGVFSLVAQGMTVEEAEVMGQRLAAVAEAFAPAAHSPLRVSVGHAGPECSTDLSALNELANRAEVAAQSSDRSAVVGAIELIGTMAVATQLDVTLRLTNLASDRSDGPPREQVAEVAAELADRLGFEGREKLLVRFCAHVATIGTVLTDDPDSDHLQVAAQLLGTTAGFHVSETVLGLSERWDGSGGPQGLSGPAIPAPARIVAVAEALVRDGFETESISTQSGLLYDPSVVAAAVSYAGSR